MPNLLNRVVSFSKWLLRWVLENIAWDKWGSPAVKFLIGYPKTGGGVMTALTAIWEQVHAVPGMTIVFTCAVLFPLFSLGFFLAGKARKVWLPPTDPSPPLILSPQAVNAIESDPLIFEAVDREEWAGGVWCQVRVNVNREIPDCTVHAFYDGKDPNGIGVIMHWQSLAGKENAGVPLLTLKPGKPYRIPLVQRRKSLTAPSFTTLLDGEALKNNGSENIFSPGDVKYFDVQIWSPQGKFKSGKIFKMMVPDVNAENSQFVVEIVRP